MKETVRPSQTKGYCQVPGANTLRHTGVTFVRTKKTGKDPSQKSLLRDATKRLRKHIAAPTSGR